METKIDEKNPGLLWSTFLALSILFISIRGYSVEPPEIRNKLNGIESEVLGLRASKASLDEKYRLALDLKNRLGALLKDSPDLATTSSTYNNSLGLVDYTCIEKARAERDDGLELNLLIESKDAFGRAITLHNRSNFVRSLAMTYRLIGEYYEQKFWDEVGPPAKDLEKIPELAGSADENYFLAENTYGMCPGGDGYFEKRAIIEAESNSLTAKIEKFRNNLTVRWALSKFQNLNQKDDK